MGSFDVIAPKMAAASPARPALRLGIARALLAAGDYRADSGALVT